MADELKISIAEFSFTKGGATVRANTREQTIDISGANAIHNIQNVGTSAEDLVLGDVAATGWMWFRNLSNTTCEIGTDLEDAQGFYSFADVHAGEEQMFRAPAGIGKIQAQFVSTPGVLEYIMIDP